ncbi:MAG: ABC transporter permease [Dehalococcoidia bacterium]
MIGLLEIWRRRFQFALIALIVTLISYLVLMINGLGVGLNNLAGSALKNWDAEAIAYSQQAGLSVIRSEIGPDTIQLIESNDRVEESAPLGYVAANYRDSKDEIASAAFIGFEPGTIGEPAVTEGNSLTSSDRDGLLADKSFLKAAGLDVGDTVTVSLRLTSREFRIVGEIDEGAFFFQPAVYVLLTTWQELKYGTTQDVPAASIVLLKGDDVAGLQGDGFEAVSKSEAFANIEGVQGQQSTVTALRWFGYLIGALVIGVFFYVLTIQKVPQIGVLKAIGASDFFVFRQLLLQVVTLSLLGLAVSVPLAWATEQGLERLPDAVPIGFTTSTYVTTSLTLLVTAIVGALISVRQVFKTDPIIALGQQQ